MEQQQIQGYLESHKKEIIDNLCNLVAIPSISSDKDNVKKALHFTLDLAKSLGFQAESVLDDQIGIVEIGQGEESLGILTHVDVVSPGDWSAWDGSPFEPEIVDGRIYGRGTQDDKGAIIACLYAMKAAVDSGQTFHKKVRLVLGTQEEVNWTDMRAYIEEFSMPDYGFTPDSQYPICNIEKGILNLDMIFPLPSEEEVEDGLYLTSIDAGATGNSIPGRCTAYLTRHEGRTITMETVRVNGKSVHSCQPEQGSNAIFVMADELGKMGLCCNPLLKLLQMVEEKFRDPFGRSLGLYNESEYYEGEFVHRNVFSPTIMSVSGNEVRIHINVRFAYGSDPDEILQGLEELAKEYGGYTENHDIDPAVYVNRNRPFLQKLAEAYEEVTGLENEFALAYSGSYAKAIPNIVSWGPLFPGDADTSHIENEYIGLDCLMKNAAVFASAIDKIVFTQESFL